ncbi:hypothetical protein AM1_0631 [Acaryochloris marina MBIC11017]|uniref:Uncharacterized protein n=1 Tax=Acaryochloris marina (strain MBIC 11017) TaxID=329726 RepID=B0CD89_ACAM1|nr:hypothetical protein AM1_0631 [Acaryochloris marina MBIC11017]
MGERTCLKIAEIPFFDLTSFLISPLTEVLILTPLTSTQSSNLLLGPDPIEPSGPFVIQATYLLRI